MRTQASLCAPTLVTMTASDRGGDTLDMAREALAAVSHLPTVLGAWLRDVRHELPPGLSLDPAREPEVEPLHRRLREEGRSELITDGFGLWSVDPAGELALVVNFEPTFRSRPATEQIRFLATLFRPLAVRTTAELGMPGAAGSIAAGSMIDALIESFALGSILVCDVDLRVVAGGGGARRQFNLPSCVPGTSAEEAYPAFMWPRVEAELREALTGRVVTSKLEVAGGHFIVRSCPLRDAHGEVAGVVRIAHDVSRQFELRDQLDSVRTLLEESLRAGSRASFRIVAHSGEIQWSPEAAEVLGFDGPLPSFVDELLEHVDGRDLETVSDAVRAAFRNEGTLEVSFRTTEATPRWIRVDGQLIRDGQPRIAGLVHDATEAVQAEEERFFYGQQLEVAKARAEAGERAKGIFLGLMSHELRTPLNGVIAAASLLAEEDLTLGQVELVELIRRSSEVLIGALDDVLELSFLEGTDAKPPDRTFDLRNMIARVVEPHRRQAERTGSTLSVALSEVDNPVRVGDPNRIGRCLDKLVANAVKFTDRGEIAVEITEPEPERLRFEVADTGVGISAVDQAKLFRPFHQVDASAARRFEGLGLGLVLVRRMVDSLGGRVGCTSTEGVGSRFWFEVPMRAGRPLPPGEGLADRPLRVLVAEDNPVNQKVVVRMLERLGHTATVARDGEEAVRAFVPGAFDLVLMDLRMPRMDGLEATRAIRAVEAGGRERCPVWALTANALDSDRVACLEAGMDRFLTKPLRAQQLKTILAQT